jgi:hypothetical protein
MRHTNRTSSREVGHKVFCHGGQQNLVTPYIFYIYIYMTISCIFTSLRMPTHFLVKQ